MTASKIVAAAASGVGSAGLDVDEVFNTQLWNGTNASQTITNGIDLTEGGLIWTKARTSDPTEQDHQLLDTEQGAFRYVLESNTANARFDFGASMITPNTNGFTLTSSSRINQNTYPYVGWTWRKAPKWFDVVTYSGTSNSATDYQDISHNLGAIPGMVIVKRLNSSENWAVWHRSIDSSGDMLQLNITDSKTGSGGRFSANNQSNMTATTFRVYGDNQTGANGGTYVAYLFAHNNSDGEFGPDSDQDIIKCGSYSGNGSSTGPVVDLGFEPQWLMIKNASSSGPWVMLDNMRGWPVTDDVTYNDHMLWANTDDAEYTTVKRANITPTGFQIRQSNSQVNTNGNTYIYMAIRRGPLAAPDDATKVFAISQQLNTSGSTPSYNSGFPVDMAINKFTTGTDAGLSDRLRGAKDLLPSNNIAEYANSVKTFDYMDGYYNPGAGANSNYYSWMWKRAPGYFDVVCYTGTESNRTVSHNLGVAPEMMWIKSRSQGGSTYTWQVYHSGMHSTPTSVYLTLNTTDPIYGGGSARWNSTAPSSTSFSIGTGDVVNKSGETFIAYLFATVSGVSKVGSYTGTGDASAQTIDCGFSSGAKMVIIKCSSNSGQWYIFDVDRGITNTVNDGVLMLNNTTAQSPESSAFGASIDAIQPDSSGFKVQYGDLNQTGRTFIFYAVA